MKHSVYIETTIVSYLAARPSNNLLQSAYQQQTHQWWSFKKQYKLYAADLVIDEALKGDKEQAENRIKLLDNCELLVTTIEILSIAKQLINHAAPPQKSNADATHIAIAAVNNIDYLLTWNCKHIANPTTFPTIQKTLELLGYKTPILLTPANLLDQNHASN